MVPLPLLSHRVQLNHLTGGASCLSLIFKMDCVLINLDKDSERLESVTEHLNGWGIEFRRIPGVEHEDPKTGFNIAMMNALKSIPNGGIIFEDDVLLLDWFIPELPHDYDLCYFGANLKDKTERVNDRLVRVYGAWTTHAVMYSKQGVEKAMQFDFSCVYDDWLRNEYAKRNKCYMVTPMIAYQREGYSNIELSHSRYTDVMNENYKTFVDAG